MFYSESLLAKTGPLAKVWLAANVERKLTKGDCLKQDIEKDVRNIVDTNQAPLALRLTSQLLLGVVRIYSRKARYLLDDCNDALMKIKLAFKPGNVDLPANQSHTANPASLLLPETITELDLFAPMPDPEELLLGPTRAPGQDPTLLDWGTSQVLPASFDDRRDQTLQLEEDDLGLDLGDDILSPAPQDRSIEVGRRAETPRTEMRDESMLYQDDLGLDLGLDLPLADDTTLPPQYDDDYPMAGVDNLDLGLDDTALPEQGDPKRLERDTASPLSTLRLSVERELERTFQLEEHHEPEVEDETMVQAQQRVKRRKVLPADVTTELHNSQIKAQQEDRSKILKAPTFLPRDPLLMALMNMQKSGGFVSNVLGDGRSLGWAPELRGVLSIEVVRRAGELKRKRDSGVAELEIPSDEEDRSQAVIGGELTPPPDEQVELDLGGDDFGPILSDGPAPPAEDETVAAAEEEEEAFASSPAPAFDETTMPILHPADSGPVSLGTKHAVHMLREHFSTPAGEAPSPRARAQQSVLFTDLCPEQHTSRQNATKMFFEILVLGTKDAVKVEQDSDELGAPLMVRGKRGLWGSWAEIGVATQSQGVARDENVLEAGEEGVAV